MDAYQPPRAPIAPDESPGRRTHLAIAAFLATTVAVPASIFLIARVLAPDGDIAYGNTRFWVTILLAGFVSSSLVYRTHRLRLAGALAAGAGIGVLGLALLAGGLELWWLLRRLT
jgi:hypothetical protein